MKPASLALGLVLPLFATAGLAQDLKVGMDAPPLQIAKWVKGAAVDAFKPGQVYVIEFWATWCGPCIASMPHLSQLQRSYKDKGVSIIGVTTADARGNTLAKVEAMVTDKGDGMDYAVAWDDGTKTSDAYLKAAKQNGIPCSFLVDAKGKLAYIGHPMTLDIPLPAVIDGTWDAAKGKQQIDATMKKIGEAVEAAAKDADGGRGAIEAAVGKNDALAKMANLMLFDKLVKDASYDRAFAMAPKLVEQAIAAKDPIALNDVSWAIVDPDAKIEKRDLDVAMKAAAKAVELTKEKDGAILDTLARVYFWKKDYAKAVELQKKAVALDPRDEIKKSLDEYQTLADKAAGGDVKKTDK